MSERSICPTCGSELPPGDASGLCPRCLLRIGLSGGSQGLARDGGPDATSTGADILDSIADVIGSVPRVLLSDTQPVEQPSRIDRPRAAQGADRTIRYRIDGEIASGGMGTILKGHDPDVGRDVALKVLREDLFDNADMVRRFVEEAQIGGQLQHPGIVPIYELGTFVDKRPFFSMKLVKGHTLARLLEGREDPADDLPRFLSIFESIAQTVAYAHARGVIHRDLKPSNVMVGPFGEVQVMDWGLAKVLTRGGIADDAQAAGPEGHERAIATARSSSEDPYLSRAGSVMGTPSHMAPEQARGEIDRVDKRADVFALGSILCQILTGDPAFAGNSTSEIHGKAARGELVDASGRLDACGAEAELSSLARNCLEREQDDRPRDAGAVAGRITAYLGGVQERLRAAEIARGAEAARAEEATHTAAQANERTRAERRARRFQVGLAASLLVLTAVGGLSFTYLLQQRQIRASRREQGLAEITVLLDKARHETGDPGLWREALTALKRVDGQGQEARVEALRSEIVAGLDDAERSARLRQDLVEIRANEQDVGPAGTDAAYALAFRTAGLDLNVLEPAEFARRLKLLPEAVVIELSAFLDDWSAVLREAERAVAVSAKPVAAARLSDPDPYRDHIRMILLAGDRRPEAAALKALAAARDAADLPAPTAVLLGRTLADLGQTEAAVALLRSTIGRHPGDVWVNCYLAEALDKLRPSAREEAARYYTAARALRPETAHALAHLLDRMGRGAEAESIFRDLTNRRPDNPRHLGCLGSHLKQSGRAADIAPVIDRALAAAGQAIRLKPNDAEAHNNLGLVLRAQGKLDEAIAESRTAIRLNPYETAAHNNLGLVLGELGKLDEAIAEYREAIRLKPDDAGGHYGLGNALIAQGKRDEAAVEYREAIRLKPDDAGGHYGLGNALIAQGKRDEAAVEYREAIRLKPDDAGAHNNLGVALGELGKRDEAIAEYREAIRLRPDDARIHSGLGNALMAQGKRDEAIAEYRATIRLNPDDAGTHFDLGLALQEQGQSDEAVAEFRSYVRLRPDDAGAHWNLGVRLEQMRRYDDAVEAYRLASRRDGKHVGSAILSLARLLERAGHYGEAAETYEDIRRMLEDDPHPDVPTSDRRAEIQTHLVEINRFKALDHRFAAVTRGHDHPAGGPERLDFARMARDRGFYATASRLWIEALQANPGLGADRGAQQRYSAACAAALAASGAGKDEPQPDDVAKAKLRAQALGQLKGERDAWAKLLDGGDPNARALVAQTLQHWKVDADLSGIRDATSLSRLVDPERKEWQSLWSDVDALLKRAGGRSP